MAEADDDSVPRQPEQQQQQQPAQPSTLSRWTPSIPTNLMSIINPFSTTDDDKSSTNASSPAQPSKKKQSFLASLMPGSSPAEPPPSPDKDDTSIMFSEPDTHSNSDDASREGSVNELGRTLSKRSNKPKTSYSICHPAPSSSTRQKLHRRPRSLLQLHKLSSGARPLPAYEIVPSANFSVRLQRAITKVFKTKHGLCPNDLVVMKAEKYSTHELDEEQEARDIVALICKGRKEEAGCKARICLPDGHEWEAYSIANGAYEFFSTDEHGLRLTTRWVPKRNKDGNKQIDPRKKRFNFSTISPNSRRHPVIAGLSRTQLDINDVYKMPNPSATTPLSTPKQTSTILADAMEDEQDDMEQQCHTDDRLRTIILMTGIWVAFKEGWSPNFKYDDKDAAPSFPRSPSMQHSPSKSATFSTPPASSSVTPSDKRHSFKGVGVLRSASLLRKGNRSSSASAPELDPEVVAQFDQSNNKKTGRARADSASTVLVHRAASNRAKHHHATWRPDLLDAQREMPESSSEDVSRGNTAFRGSPRRRVSLAKPSLSYADGSADVSQDESVGEVEPRHLLTPLPGAIVPEKRESSTTTATTTSTTASERPRKSAALRVETGGKRKSSGWKRLLCGSGQGG